MHQTKEGEAASGFVRRDSGDILRIITLHRKSLKLNATMHTDRGVGF